jgi:uncharacterized protein YutE (UPF0331/DUF86 family)
MSNADKIPQSLKKLASILQQLDAEGTKLQKKIKEGEDPEELKYSYITWHQQVCTHFTPLLNKINQETLAKKIEDYNYSIDNIIDIRGRMRGVQRTIEQGKLINLTYQFQKDELEQELNQIGQLLDSDEKDIEKKVLMAMLTSVVLENGVRKLCSRHNIILADEKWKPLTQLIDSLKKQDVISHTYAQQLDVWRKIRNDVVHGKTDSFNIEDVEDMLKGVKKFIAEYL